MEPSIVWTEDRETGAITATIKSTNLAAKRAYLKIGRSRESDALSRWGWAIATDAEPSVRVAAGLTPFAH